MFFYYFQFSFNLKVTLYEAKNNSKYRDWASLSLFGNEASLFSQNNMKEHDTWPLNIIRGIIRIYYLTVVNNFCGSKKAPLLKFEIKLN